MIEGTVSMIETCELRQLTHWNRLPINRIDLVLFLKVTVRTGQSLVYHEMQLAKFVLLFQAHKSRKSVH